MKSLLSLTALAIALTGTLTAPVMAADQSAAPAWATDLLPGDGFATDEVERRGRKRPRVPGGSGCDDPRDVRVHPECRA